MWVIEEHMAYDMKGFVCNKSSVRFPHLSGRPWAVFDEYGRSFVEDENVKVEDHSEGHICQIQQEELHFCSVQLNAYPHQTREEDRSRVGRTTSFAFRRLNQLARGKAANDIFPRVTDEVLTIGEFNENDENTEIKNNFF